MRKSHILQFFFLLVFAVCQPAFAGVNRWTGRGPEGGSVSTIVVDPMDDAIVSAALGNGAGVYKSTNGGDRWTAINDGLTSLYVTALTLEPERSALYAGTRDGKVFRSENAGENWVEWSRPDDRSVLSIIVMQQSVVVATLQGVFRTVDDGSSWQRPSALSRIGAPRFLAASPKGDIFCEPGQTFPLYVSRDGGASWNALPSAPDAMAIAFGPDGSIILGRPSGIFSSLDGGATWRKVANAVAPRAVFVSNSGRLYVSDGMTDVKNVGKVHIQAFAASSGASPRIFAGSLHHGVLTKIEDSTDWTTANRGIAGGVVMDLAAFPFDSSLLYAATLAGLYKSTDAGENWKKIDDATDTVAVDPLDSSIVFAGRADLKKSVDGGATWTIVQPSTRAIAIAPSNPATIYASLSMGLRKSTDRGDSWISVMNDMPIGMYSHFYGFDSVLAIDPHDESTVYVGQEEGLFKTTNGGARWNKVSSEPWIRAIAIDPANSNLVYAASWARLSRSLDGGRNWSPAGLSGRHVTALAVASDSTAYAGTAEGDIYRSTARGEQWQPFSDGLPGIEIKRISIDASGRHLFAATGAGVFEYEIADLEIETLPPDSGRFSRLLKELLAEADYRSGFVFLTGSTRGVSGQYRGDVKLRNRRRSDQEVVLAWLAMGNESGDVPLFRAVLPSSNAMPDGAAVPNLVDRLGLSGTGSLVVIAVDAAGNVDREASIDGSSRICAHSSGRLPVCQTFPAARADRFRAHSSASVAGLRQDPAFRTNVGIVNLDENAHRFTVTVSGERQNDRFELSVAPFSMIQAPVPGGDFGELTITVVTDDGTAPWLSYGSTVENATGASVTSIGLP